MDNLNQPDYKLKEKYFIPFFIGLVKYLKENPSPLITREKPIFKNELKDFGNRLLLGIYHISTSSFLTAGLLYGINEATNGSLEQLIR